MSDPSEENTDGSAPISLSPPEQTVLLTLRNATDLPIDEDQVATDSGLAPDQVRGSLQRLRSKHLAVLDEEHLSVRSLTPRGQAAVSSGLPERRFLDALGVAAVTFPSRRPRPRASRTRSDPQRSASFVGVRCWPRAFRSASETNMRTTIGSFPRRSF